MAPLTADLLPLVATQYGFIVYGDKEKRREVVPYPRGPPHLVGGLRYELPFSAHVRAITAYARRCPVLLTGTGRTLELAMSGEVPTGPHFPQSDRPAINAFTIGDFVSQPEPGTFAATVQFFRLDDQTLMWAQLIATPPDWWYAHTDA